MAYEIPQQLAYKEKIIFGLTFKQLAYLFVFAPLISFIFFKTSLNFYFKVFLAINLSALAVGFIFLELDHHLRVWIGWLLTRKLYKPKHLQKFIPIEAIQDNFILTRDKRKIAILKVTPINFSIKHKDAQEALTSQFQKFLNSLDFPIQILMSTEALDLADYFTTIKERVSEKFSSLFEHYKAHLQSVTSGNNVMNRSFYMVIPEKTDITIQLALCQSKLDSLGLKSSRVTTDALKKLAKTFFEHQAPTKPIEHHPSYVHMGSTLTRTICAYGYPRTVEAGFLDKIVSSLGMFDLSLHIEPYDIETMMINLNKELQKQSADLYAAKLKGMLNPSLEIKFEDTQSVLKNLQKGEEKLFNISLYVTCRAKTPEELKLLTNRIEAELNSLLIIPKQATFRMLQGLQSCAPLAFDKLAIKRNVTTHALSAFFPFTSSFLQADKTGVWLGLNRNKIPIIKDIFTLSNPNGICLASSGSGKSYMSKLLIARYLLTGTKVMVIDPQGEYRNLVERFNGQRIDLSRTSDTIINPLDLMGHPYPEKRLALMDLMPIMLGDLTDPQRAFIDKALTEAYEKHGITNDQETWNNRPPIMQDVLYVLERMEKKALLFEKPTVRSLINRLDMYVNGVFSFLNQHTRLNFDNQFVCFDIGNLPKQVKPTIMFLVLDYIYMKMKETIERKLLVIDEAWSLLGRTEDASYVFEIVKTCRKFNLALFLINQEVEGMLESEAGKSVLANSSYTLLMRQKPAVMKAIQETFFLSQSERTFLLTASVGEGLLLMDDEHSEIKIVASEEEHKLITTNADERLKFEAEEKKQKPTLKQSPQQIVTVKVDATKSLYLRKNLSLHDIKYLISKGYRESKHMTLQGRHEAFLIKPRANESAEHCFLVFEIARYLKSKGYAIELFNSVKPDIVFTNNGKEYALEIETGSVYVKDKSKFAQKVITLKENYADKWLFVVTNYRLASTYNEFGKTLWRTNFITQFEKWLEKH